MDNFTPAEQAVIDRQGWDADSLVSILTGHDPERGPLLFHMERIAAEENAGEVRDIENSEDVPALLGGDAELIGKTIQRIEYVTVPGAFGEDNGILLHFTDGTAHTFVQPAFEE